MTASWAFKQLGIEATTEVALIRRAYSHRLKAMDVDEDVDSFERLRAARDAALAYAAGRFEDNPSGDSYEEPEHPVDDLVVMPVHVGTIDGIPHQSPGPVDEVIAAQQRFVDILFPGGEQMYHLTADETEEALHCFERMKSDPRLENIDTLAHASDWFANAIAQSLPRSDPIVQPVVHFFGWSRDDEVGVHPAVAAVVGRANALDFRQALQSKSHRLHRAWKELTTPATDASSRGWVRPKKIGELLTTIRTRYPSLENDMDWYRVDMWEGVSGPSGKMPIGLFIVLIIIAVRAFTPALESPEPRRSPIETVFKRPLTTADADIESALDGYTLGALDIPRIREGNPKLYDYLKQVWADHKESGDLVSFLNATDNLFEDFVKRGWPQASYSVLRDKMELIVRTAKGMSPRDCADFLVGRLGASGPPPTFENDLRKLYGDVLLGVDPTHPGHVPPELRSYRIPGSIVADAEKRSGLGSNEFSDALDMNQPVGSNAKTVCAARIALRQAILARPQPEAFPVLRDMER